MTPKDLPEPADLYWHGLATPKGIGKVTVIRTPTRSTTCIVTCVQDQSKVADLEGSSSVGAAYPAASNSVRSGDPTNLQDMTRIVVG